MRIIHLLVLITVASAAAASAGETPTMVCRNGIVSRGDSAAEILAKCGEPVVKTQREEIRIDHGNHGVKRSFNVTVDDWTFNFGPDAFMHRLELENGKVTRIESLQYGY